MHICFHMFLFVWCRISLVVSVQPVFSIQNSESFTQTILSHLHIFTTNSFVLNAGKSRLGAFCRRRWLQPFPRVFCIKMNFTTDSLDSHQFFLICTSPQQFFHFFHSNSFVQQQLINCEHESSRSFLPTALIAAISESPFLTATSFNQKIELDLSLI